LVESHSAGAHGPGRPRIVYTLSPAARRSGGDEHRLLAAILSGVVAGVPDAEARSEVAGYQWGRHVAAAAPGGAAAGGDAVDAVDAVSALLEVQGFEPEPEAERLAIRMRRCPFHDLAEAHPEVVCAVHRGFVTGALSELGSDLVVSGLDVFVEPDLGAGLEAQLLHDVGAVRLGRAHRDVEHLRDLLVRVPQGEQAQHLALSLR